MGQFSSFLIAEPSSCEGAARIFDFADSLTEYNYSRNPDELANWADWIQTGDDLKSELGRFSEGKSCQATNQTS